MSTVEHNMSGVSPSSDTSEKDTNHKKTKTTITFRIDRTVMQKINTRAEHEDITLNALVNKILKRYAEWGMYEGRAGMVPVNRGVITRLFEGLSKEEVVTMSQELAKNEVYNIALFMKGKSELDVDSFISWFLSRMKNCSEIIENEENHNKIYCLKHDLGENWSLYHKTVLDSIFKEYLQTPIRISISASTIIFTVQNRKESKRIHY